MHRREAANEMAKHRQEAAAQLEMHRQASADDMNKLNLTITDKIRSAKYDLVKWFFPAFVALAGLIIALAAFVD